jgi:hypothetical protein
VGRQRIVGAVAAVFAIVAVFYFVKPFSIRLEPVRTPPRLAAFPTPDRTTAECSAPWRQLVDAPLGTTHLRTVGPHFSIEQHDRQPLCGNTGRSRAIFSGWFLLGALVLGGTLVGWPKRRIRGADTPPAEAEPVLIDVI